MKLRIFKFFQVTKLSKILNKYKKTHFLDADFIINQILEQISFNKNDNFTDITPIFDMESSLYNKVNECFQSQQFGLLPISIVYRIIEKSEQDKISNDLLFDFISESIEERFILFTFLNVYKLTRTKFDELFDLYNKTKDSNQNFFQHLPVDLLFIKSINDEK